MTTIKQIWSGPKEVLEQAAMVLGEVVFPPADAISLVKIDPTESDQTSTWELHAYFEELPEIGLLDAAFREMSVALPSPVCEDLPEQDWVAHSLEGLGIVEAGDFVLYGSHDADKLSEYAGIPLQIEANRAFGTGHHPTTAGCLEALTRLKEMTPQSVLDVGTGSGVLAIAACKLWPDANIFGTDIDEPSIDISVENAELNGTDTIKFEVATGLGQMVDANGPFPLILANILAEPLIQLASDVANALSQDSQARVVLAGLLDRQETAVLSAYREVGLDLVDRVDNATWPVLILGRRSAASA